ncbi:DUF190 domain-containing protein [Oceanicaulis sp. LC35]|uniref:DUF190 domain-containing protein n=1 Tax=Oceanicaulis sp. LC35 TaxID=3349635 RepID=UPI003F86C2C7
MSRTVRKKLIAIVETPHLKRLIDLFRQCGVTGFTVIEGREGSGLGGDWTREDVLDATEMKVVLSVMKPETAEKVFELAEPFFARYPGIIYAHDVEVVRGERF